MINLTWGLRNMKKNDFKQWWGLASTDMCICEPDQPLSNQMSSDILLISTRAKLLWFSRSVWANPDNAVCLFLHSTHCARTTLWLPKKTPHYL